FRGGPAGHPGRGRPAGHHPGTMAGPRPGPMTDGRQRPGARPVLAGVLLVALAAGIFGLLPRLGGLTREAGGLRHARPAYLAAAIAAEAISFGSYAQLYRRGLAALGGRGRVPLGTPVSPA